MNASRTRRVFWLGLFVSVLLHLGLLSRDWVIPLAWEDPDESPPIEARLALAQPQIKPEAPPVKRNPKPPAPKPPASNAPLPPQVEEARFELPPPGPLLPNEFAELMSTTLPVTSVETNPVVTPEPEPEAPKPEPASLPPLNRLPPRLTLEYRARYGIASGKQTLLWVSNDDRYTITSVISANGLASLAFPGKLVQTSRGRITAQGLQPEEFWDQRGDKRRQSRFDYVAHLIQSQSHKGVRTDPLPEGLQDVQSLLFQIALTAPPPVDSESAVFTGKKVRNYRYRVMGEEVLNTPMGALRALRMIRIADVDAERFEIWLAVDHDYLPIKLATEISDYDAELVVESITSE